MYCTVHYYTVLYCTVLYYTVQYCTILYCAVLCCIILYCTVLYCTILYYTVLCCTVLYYTVLYCTILYNAVLYCTWFSWQSRICKHSHCSVIGNSTVQYCVINILQQYYRKSNNAPLHSPWPQKSVHNFSLEGPTFFICIILFFVKVQFQSIASL